MKTLYVEPSRANVDGQVRLLRKPKTDDTEFGRVDPRCFVHKLHSYWQAVDLAVK